MTRRPLLIALAIGMTAALAAWFMPHPVRLSGADVGDIGLSLAGLSRLHDGGSPYDVRLRGSHPSLYPMTALVLLSPLKLFPLRAAPALFIGVTSFALAYAIGRRGEMWQLLMFASPCYWSAVHSVQWSPLFTAALLLPALLAVAVAKPQLGIVLAAAGTWSKRTLLAAAALVALTFAVRPSWLVEWFRYGNLGTFNGVVPLMVFPGFLLIASAFAWRTPRGRLMLAMAVVPQRYLYDQLPLFVVARTWRQMVTLLATSWATVALAFAFQWVDLASGVQRTEVWRAIVIGLFVPATAMLLMPRAVASDDPQSSRAET
ncbi:MAG TPA: hypothetical protein VLU46_02035 [Thermoanaerobaculia bacterium]|nr:hypothetical protein [Thermoanaerobaculia bacterium]